MISLPFTISAIILIVACSISKIQYSSTYIAIAIHAFLGPLETASLVAAFILYIQSNEPKFSIQILFISALGLIGMLNFIAFVIQTPFIAHDRKFLRWLKRRDFQKSTQFNIYWFYFISIFTMFSNYKLKMLLFSRLFSFDCLKCQLEGLQKFKIFNIFVFLGLVPQIIVLYSAWVQLLSINSSQNVYSALIDVIVIFLANIVFSLLSVVKQKDFFKDQIDGVTINKVFNLAQQSFQTSVKMGGNALGYSLEDIIQVNQMAYESTKRDIASLNNHQKQRLRDEQKVDIQGLSEENTVTDRYSQNKYEQDQIQEQGRSRNNIEKEEVNNILMVDQYFSFASDNNQNQLEHSQNYKGQQHPDIQLNRNAQILEEPQLFSSQQGLVQEQEQLKHNKTNLADYLIQSQKKTQLEKKKNEKQLKYDIVDLETNKLSEENPKERDTEGGKFISQIVNQEIVQYLPQYQTQIDNQSQINCRSEPPATKYNQSTTDNHCFQPSLFQYAINKIVARHHSPKKDISENNIQRKIGRNPSKKTSFQLNEDHQQRAVSNRSKQKIKSVHNHPIKTSQSKNKSSSSHKAIDYNQQQDLIQQKKNSKSPNREHLKIKIMNDSTSQIKSIEKKEDQGNSRVLNTIREDQFFNQFLKHQNVSEQKQEVVKEFKRSVPQSLTFFPQKKRQEVELQESDQLNFPPRKPTASIIQKLKQRFSSAKTRERSQTVRSKVIFQRSSKSAKRNKSSESKRNNFDNLRSNESNEIHRTESYTSQQKSKKYSLQKIYLQKLTR